MVQGLPGASHGTLWGPGLDLGWILALSGDPLGDPWGDLVVNRGAQIEENEGKVAAQEGARTKSVIRLLPRWPNVAPIQ